MKPELLKLFTPEILREAAVRFGLDPDRIETLDGFENFVCACHRNGEPYILRISHSGRRSRDMIGAELHWIAYLARNAASVCTPLPSRADRLIEVIEIPDCELYAAVFETARGGQVRRDDQTPEMAISRGRLLGRIHTLSKSYTPSGEIVRRMQWYEEDDFSNFARHLGPSDAIVAQKLHELIARLRSIPQTPHDYGLIHFDPHTGNTFFDGDHPTLFDFDDSACDYYVSDIGIALFCMILFLPEEKSAIDFARDFLQDLLRGYREECPIDSRMLEYIPLILKRRELILYVAIHRGMDTEHLDDWSTRYLDGRRERIANDVPVLDMDFSGF